MSNRHYRIVGVSVLTGLWLSIGIAACIYGGIVPFIGLSLFGFGYACLLRSVQ